MIRPDPEHLLEAREQLTDAIDAVKRRFNLSTEELVWLLSRHAARQVAFVSDTGEFKARIGAVLDEMLRHARSVHTVHVRCIDVLKRVVASKPLRSRKMKQRVVR